MNKCSTCNQEIKVTCDWRQGRCPHRPSLIDNPKFIIIAAMIAAPFICLWMIIRHPIFTYKVWREHGSRKQRQTQQAYSPERNHGKEED
jgi:hypothetical protein